MHFIAQRLPRDISRSRQSADDDVRSRRHRGKQLKRYRLEATANEIAPHGVTHILCDDESEANRDNDIRGYGAGPNLEDGVCTDDPYTTPNDALVIAATRNAIYVSEHENLATIRTYAESSVRPLRRRAPRMARPARVRMRRRKPCTLARRRLFGWKVLLLIVQSPRI